MRVIPPSELIINADGSVFHLHLKPGQLSDKIILVGDPERVSSVASRFDSIECEVSNREFHSITGYFQGKRISVVSHGIGTARAIEISEKAAAFAALAMGLSGIFTAIFLPMVITFFK